MNSAKFYFRENKFFSLKKHDRINDERYNFRKKIQFLFCFLNYAVDFKIGGKYRSESCVIIIPASLLIIAKVYCVYKQSE